MIQIIILAGPVLTALFYFLINLFNRITEVLVLEQQIENIVEAGLEENPADDEMAAIGGNLIANYRQEGGRKVTPNKEIAGK